MDIPPMTPRRTTSSTAGRPFASLIIRSCPPKIFFNFPLGQRVLGDVELLMILQILGASLQDLKIPHLPLVPWGWLTVNLNGVLDWEGDYLGLDYSQIGKQTVMKIHCSCFLFFQWQKTANPDQKKSRLIFWFKRHLSPLEPHFISYQRSGSNRHFFRGNRILSPARLPIPPRWPGCDQ